MLFILFLRRAARLARGKAWIEDVVTCSPPQWNIYMRECKLIWTDFKSEINNLWNNEQDEKITEIKVRKIDSNIANVCSTSL